jgi:hypothetical protein
MEKNLKLRDLIPYIPGSYVKIIGDTGAKSFFSKDDLDFHLTLYEGRVMNNDFSECLVPDVLLDCSIFSIGTLLHKKGFCIHLAGRDPLICDDAVFFDNLMYQIITGLKNNTIESNSEYDKFLDGLDELPFD